MAAVILEFISRRVEERGAIEVPKQTELHAFFEHLSRSPYASHVAVGGPETEA
jgi:hypothetical protein